MRILMLGNSFTFANNMPAMLAELTGAEVVHHTRGGARLAEQLNNVDVPYDRKHHAARYSFTQCPNAEFAKKHDLLHVLPLMCNSDFFGIGEIHGQLICCGTCGNSDACDYMVVGNTNPIAKSYETVTDERGFLVSRKKKTSILSKLDAIP